MQGVNSGVGAMVTGTPELLIRMTNRQPQNVVLGLGAPLGEDQ
jgi:hypothetical protein